MIACFECSRTTLACYNGNLVAWHLHVHVLSFAEILFRLLFLDFPSPLLSPLALALMDDAVAGNVPRVECVPKTLDVTFASPKEGPDCGAVVGCKEPALIARLFSQTLLMLKRRQRREQQTPRRLQDQTTLPTGDQ